MKTMLTAAAVLLIAGTATAQGQLPVLLMVDNTDPSNVLISATGAAPAVNGSVGVISGVTLMGLFGGAGINLPITTVVGGNLAGGGSAFAYNRGGNAFGTLSANDLNIWVTGGSGNQNFNVANPAFVGVMTGNYAGATFNDSGEIRLGDTISGVVLGQWRLIPTPGALALFGVAGMAATRRRRG
jgi:hypothetical protein